MTITMKTMRTTKRRRTTRTTSSGVLLLLLLVLAGACWSPLAAQKNKKDEDAGTRRCRGR